MPRRRQTLDDFTRIVDEMVREGITFEQARAELERRFHAAGSDPVADPGLAEAGSVARDALAQIQRLYELSLTELGRLFGTSRQAVTIWLRQGVPAARKPKLYTVLNVGQLLARQLKPNRLPAVARREAAAWGGATMLGMIAADRHEELLRQVRSSFDWAATA